MRSEVNRCPCYSDKGREVIRILSAFVASRGKVSMLVFSTCLGGQNVASVYVYVYLICPRAPIPRSAQ